MKFNVLVAKLRAGLLSHPELVVKLNAIEVKVIGKKLSPV